jgi:hypothetical protein
MREDMIVYCVFTTVFKGHPINKWETVVKDKDGKQLLVTEFNWADSPGDSLDIAVSKLKLEKL